MTSLLQALRRVDLASVPDQHGRVVLVTGGNSGIGFQAARALALRNAHVLIASQNAPGCAEAVRRIQAEHATARVECLPVDNASLRSVQACAASLAERQLRLDCLLLNAGIECPPDSTITEDGFDRTLAVNYVGHWYLTHLLLEQLSPAARVVVVSSLTEQHGWPQWGNLLGSQGPHSGGYAEYATSKLYLLMMAAELQRRLRAGGSSVDVLTAHPGLAITGGVLQKPDWRRLIAAAMVPLALAVGQSAGGGAQPLVKCATDPSLTGKGGAGQHHGPWYCGVPGRPFGQAWPLAFTPNLLNLGSRPPISPLVRDEAACMRLYEETASIVNARAPVAAKLVSAAAQYAAQPSAALP